MLKVLVVDDESVVRRGIVLGVDWASMGCVVVGEATKDVRTLEKLEEKQLEDYKAAANKENEQFIEEFVSGQSIRAHNEQRI